MSTTDADIAEDAARNHAATCRRCCVPIIDDEGNPGLFGEACREGRIVLAAYCDAIGEPVPSFARVGAA